MDDNKNNNGKYGSYFYTSSNNINNINSSCSFINFNETNTSNVSNTTNKPNRSNPRMISQGRPNPNPVNYAGRGIPKTNRSSYKPLPSPKIDSKNNDENNINEEENNEQYREPRRRSVSDITGKVKKAKDTISFFQKYKFVIIGGCIFFAIVIIFMFMMMVVKLDGDGDRDISFGGYDEITMNTNGNNNGEFWYPVGSSEITTSINIKGNNVEFRSGTPVPTSVTSPYGQRYGSFHHGVDIAAGGDIYLIAMADGVVSKISANRDTGYNNKPNASLQCSSHDGLVYIYIKHDNGIETRYLHVREKSIPSYLKEGSKVYQGQVIGMMGNTGCSTGQHLHYELRINNQSQVPSYYGILFNDPRPFAEGVTKRSEDILKEKYDRIVEETVPDSGTTVGKDNKQTVCLTFKNYGYSDTAVAALMVNIQHESNFNPNAVNSIKCSGLVQWCFGRKNNLKSTYGNQWNLINNQIEFIDKELNSGYKHVYNYINNTNYSTTEKTYYFCSKYEIPGDYYCRQRRNSSKNTEYYNYVKNGCK